MTPDQERLFRRLVISSTDFGEAYTMFRLLALRAEAGERAFSHGDLPIGPSPFSHDELIRLSLTISGVIAYARPFKKSKGTDAKRLLSLSDLETPVLGTFDDAAKNLHRELLTERDRISAHSDSELWDFQLTTDPNQGTVPRVTVPRRAFAGDYLERVVRHCQDVYSRVGLAAQRLNPNGLIDSAYQPPLAS